MPNLASALPPVVHVNVSIPRQTAGQFWFGVGLTVVIVVVLLIIHYRNRYHGLSESQKDHKSAVTESRYDQRPLSHRIPAEDDAESHRETIARMVNRATSRRGAEARKAENIDEHVTIRNAAAEVGMTVGDAWTPMIERLSSTVQRITGVAILVTVFGSLAVSTEAIISALGHETEGPGAAEVLEYVLETTTSTLSTAHGLVMTFPFADMVWAMTFVYTMLAAEWIYHHWYVLAALLVAGASVIHFLDDRVPDNLESKQVNSRLEVGVSVTLNLFTVWFVGIGPAVLGDAAGIETVGQVVGFLAASIVAGMFIGGAARSFWWRVKRTAGQDWSSTEWDTAIAAYVLSRYVWLTMTALAVPFVVIYALVILLEGKILAVGAAFLAADIAVQLVVVSVLLAVLGTLVYQARSAWGDVRAALAEAGARKQVQIALLKRGGSAFAAVFAYALAWSFAGRGFLGVVIGVIAAIVVGTAAYVAYDLAMRAKHRQSLWERKRRAPKSVLVQVYGLEDADGTVHPYVRVGGDDTLSLQETGELVDEVVAAVEKYLEGEEIDASVATWRADDLLDYGVVRREETEQRLREKVRKVIMDELRRHDNQLETARLEKRLEKFPAEICEQRRAELRREEIVRDVDDNTVLLRDPFSSQYRASR